MIMITNKLINKISIIKVGLVGAAVALSLLVGASVALAQALIYSDNTTVTVNARDYTIVSGSAATTVVISDTNTLVVTVPASSTFTLVSANRDTLTSTAGTATCTNTESTLVITGDATATTITPTSTACGAISGGGGGGGGGGGSVTSVVAQSTTPVDVVISPTGTMTTMDSGCSGSNKYNTSTGKVCVNNLTVTAGGVTYDLGTVTLKNGSKGEAVKQLQKLLNKLLKLGLAEDGKLGPKTVVVIKKWQKDNGLVADGLVGPKTKAKLNASAQ